MFLEALYILILLKRQLFHMVIVSNLFLSATLLFEFLKINKHDKEFTNNSLVSILVLPD